MNYESTYLLEKSGAEQKGLGALQLHQNRRRGFKASYGLSSKQHTTYSSGISSQIQVSGKYFRIVSFTFMAEESSLAFNG